MRKNKNQAAINTKKDSVVEPIAIIGISCRFPGGVNDTNSFWKLLLDGVDAIKEVPKDRWNIKEYYDPDPDKPGKMYTKWGGFLEQDISQFDAKFFGGEGMSQFVQEHTAKQRQDKTNPCRHGCERACLCPVGESNPTNQQEEGCVHINTDTTDFA